MKAGLDLRAVVLAGGSGTRFWPLSRKRAPKQFLPIAGRRTMIEETVARLGALVPEARVYTVANAAQSKTIGRLLPGIPARNRVVEPRGRNTAPSLILATARIFLSNPEAVVAVLPSDHVIADAPRFRQKLAAAAEAASREEALVTFGVKPTFPSTGYGYIQFSPAPARRFRSEIFRRVLEFKEKPSRETAAEYVASGDHEWNSGMFVWRASVFARQLQAAAPEFHPFWTRTLEALRTRSERKLRSVFAEIPALSIDYALLERAENVLVCEGDFGWSDVGAWSALADIWPRDGWGNAARGEVAVVDACGNVCYNPGRLTALVGVSDLVIVNTRDALLVCRKDQDQRVREVLEALAKAGRPDLA